MKNTSVREIFTQKDKIIGSNIVVQGWIRSVRSSKNFGFIELNDGSYFKNLQIVFEEELNNFKEISKLSISSAIKVEGELVESPGAKQPLELKAKNIEVLGESSPDYPLQKKRHTFEYLRSIAHLRPRANAFNAVFRVRSILAYAIHKFFQDQNFIYVHTPIITGADCEGAGEMFKVSTFDFKSVPLDESKKIDYTKDFFGKETNLTVSGQLNVESFCLAFKDVYTFGPTFRAENSNTSRHASEFWMIEPEIAFADICDNMDLAEKMMKYIISYVMENAPLEMEFFNKFIDKELFKRLDNVVNSEFGRISYTEAIDILLKADVDFEYPVKWGNDLQSEHERYLTEKVFKKPIFVKDYPKTIKAFYMRVNDDDKTVGAMDLLVPGVGEIIGGSEREERIDVLEKRMEEMNLNKDDYWWYLDIRRYGGVRHAGYGLGFERAIMYLTGMTNIRDVIPFPRTVKNADF